MDLKEFYVAVGGSYNDVMTRLPTEAFVIKFLKRFEQDPSFGELEQALAAQDVDTAFRAAHTLKGVCQNLSLDGLGRSASELTEVLRAGTLEGTGPLFDRVAADYRQTVEAIGGLDAS